MYVNVQAICQKVFLYGSLVYFLWQTRIGRTASVVLGAVVLAGVESMQTYLVGHTPEITDPLLLVLAAFTILALRKAPETALRGGAQLATSSASRAMHPPKGPAITAEFVQKVVNLRVIQEEFLKGVSERMSASITEVTRHILDEFISRHAADMAQMERDLRDKAGVAEPDTPAYQSQWVECKLILHQDHAHFVETLSAKVGLSESRILRRLISRFMSEL